MRGELDPQKRALLVRALARGESRARAAASSGYSAAQITRLLRRPEFREEVERLAKQAHANLPKHEKEREDYLGSAEAQAVAFLTRVMNGSVKATAAQISAAKALAGHAARNRNRPGLGSPAGPSAPTRASDAEAQADRAPPAERNSPVTAEDEAAAEAFLDAAEEEEGD